MPSYPFQFLSSTDVYLDHLFQTTLAGSPKTIGLYRLVNGALEAEPFLTVKEFSYQSISDGVGGLIDQFAIAEIKLPVGQALQVAAISYGDKRYSVPVRIPPRGMNRKWLFRSRALS